ncbi:type II toxin-antitoxin system RelE/ParE family toxin [Tistrella mobilis]
MTYRLVRSRRADRDLIEIWSYIAQENPDAADRTLDLIERHWWRLARYPESGATVGARLPGIRKLTTGSWLTLYRVVGDDVEIVRVMHGRRHIDQTILCDDDL